MLQDLIDAVLGRGVDVDGGGDSPLPMAILGIAENLKSRVPALGREA